MTYSEWFTQYMSLYKRKISDKTRESYLRLAQLVAPIIGAKPLEAITPDDIQAAIISAEMPPKPTSAEPEATLVTASAEPRPGTIFTSRPSSFQKPLS